MSAAQDRARAAVAAIEQASSLNAVLSFDPTTLLDQAEQLDARADLGPLAGMTVGVKDNICTLEYPTTCASRILEDYRSPFEATAVTRLKAAGGLVACKTNLDEFAMGSSTEHSAFGRCLHPERPELVPGGSSGGSAALVAAGAVDAALGSETGGSVRQPAAFCGVVGLKPGYGKVSRFGLVAFGSSLDQIGFVGRDVDTVARLFGAVAGHDPRDSTSYPAADQAAEVPADGLRGTVVGVPREYFPDELDPAVRAGCERALDTMRALGAEVREVSLPHTELSIPTYYVIAPAEASANLARYDGVRYGRRAGAAPDLAALYRDTRGAGFGPEVKRRLIVGTYVLSAGYYDAYYGKAQLARGLIERDFADVFAADVNLLFTPTTPGPAFAAGEKLTDPVTMYLADRFVCAANLAGLPAISIPLGRAGGLPVGGQFMAPVDGEPGMLEVARRVADAIDGDGEVR